VADTSDFRNGFVLKLDGDLWAIVDFQHVKPGKGGAFVRTKLKKLLEGKVVDKTFRAGERVEEVRVERRPFLFLYRSDDLFYLMDQSTYDQIPVPRGMIGEGVKYLKENTEVAVLLDGGKPISVEIPTFVDLAIARTEPGVRGDTAQGGSKPATLETGAVVSVPLFLDVGDVVRIDTRSDKYITRV
jgi:elongation factor P